MGVGGWVYVWEAPEGVRVGVWVGGWVFDWVGGLLVGCGCVCVCADLFCERALVCVLFCLCVVCTCVQRVREYVCVDQPCEKVPVHVCLLMHMYV